MTRQMIKMSITTIKWQKAIEDTGNSKGNEIILSKTEKKFSP